MQTQQHNGAPFLPLSRTPFPAVTIDQSVTTYSGRAEFSEWSLWRLEIGHLPPASYRKPNNGRLRYIGQPSWLLRLLHHVAAILIPQPVLDVLPARARRSSTAVERPTGETHVHIVESFFALRTLIRLFFSPRCRTPAILRPSAELSCP